MKRLSDKAARLLLRRMRVELGERLTRIHVDRRREQDPLSPDSSERAVQRENDEAVDAIEGSTLDEVNRIDAAIERLNAGRYGICDQCGGPIEPVRLTVIPYASRCGHCAMPDASARQP